MRWLTIHILVAILMSACSIAGNEKYASDAPRQIVFSAKDANSFYQIYALNADGSGLVQLTNWDEDSTYPSWNPDGTKIVFSSSNLATTLGPALWIMDANGKNKKPLHGLDEAIPAFPGKNAQWSPDGNEIVFDLESDLYIYDFQNEEIIELIDRPESTEANPAWSPDGNQVAFISDRDYLDSDTLRFRKDLYVIDLDTKVSKRITKTGYAREPVWTTDNNYITFRSTGPSIGSTGIYKINVKSKEITTLKKDPTSRTQLHPYTWSKDGNQILWVSRELDYSRDHIISIYDVRTESLSNIFLKSSPDNSNPAILGADWYVTN